MKIFKKIIKYLLLFVFIGFIALSIYSSYEFVNQITTQIAPGPEATQNSLTYLKDQGFDYDKFADQYAIEKTSINSSYEDYAIPFIEITNNNSKGTVILVHGMGASKESTLPHAKEFLDLGYNILAYDQRQSGENMAKTTGFGYEEANDLIDIVDYCREKLPQDKPLVVWGESWGGATVAIASAKISDKVDGLILDSPMGDGEELIRLNVQESMNDSGWLLDYMMWLGNMGLSVSQGYNFNDLKGEQYIAQTETPLLIFHSKTDKITSYQQGEAIFKASKATIKELVSVEEGDHTKLLFENPTLYHEKLTQFLAKISQ